MYELYRTTVVGRAMMDSIDEKVRNNVLTPEQGILIAQKFDEIIPRIFERVTNTIGFKGKIVSYNFVDGVWKFLCKDLMLNVNNTYYNIPYTRIVACDADTSADGGRRKRRIGK
ncbi:TFIIA g sub [Enterospora canceri]|uniref:Transcription initiation factor IIA subunit 2 n=1 Tax=Enterospora canceri TaxID=1081671 RepID=A0A1Y1S8Q4_9MICR|nr:TFIIA g sub [Enterospora canceri]